MNFKYKTDNTAAFALGCAGIMALVVIVFIIVTAIFTFLYNAVVPGIFGVGPVIDMAQGALIVGLLWVVGGFFKGTSK